MQKNRATDEEFGIAFAKTLVSFGIRISAGEGGRFRPVARLSKPLGRSEGDVGFVVESGNNPIVRTMLIVEREGSAPGNERNILKWLATAKSKETIYLRSNGFDINPKYERVHVLLCFGRSEKWNTSDFQRTAEYCSVLAKLVNKSTVRDQLMVTIQTELSVAPTWKDLGTAHAKRFVSKIAADKWQRIKLTGTPNGAPVPLLLGRIR